MDDDLGDLLIATYKPLFEAERSRRDQIRTSLAVPMTAMSVAMVGFGVLLNNFTWHQETVFAITLSGLVVALALASAACLTFGLWRLVPRKSGSSRRACPKSPVSHRPGKRNYPL